MIELHKEISVRLQCELLGVCRSNYYYQPSGETDENLKYMRLIDEQYTKTPFFGYRKMTARMKRDGHLVNKKRIRRLMRLMGLQGAVPGPHTSKPNPKHTPTLAASLLLKPCATNEDIIPVNTSPMPAVAIPGLPSRQTHNSFSVSLIRVPAPFNTITPL